MNHNDRDCAFTISTLLARDIFLVDNIPMMQVHIRMDMRSCHLPSVNPKKIKYICQAKYI